jgi:8-oxo-dGTP pyrophosphatase MutT (NUDIX family)
MRATTDLGRLRTLLAGDPAPPAPADTRLAGVLVPVLAGGEPSLVFTRRTEHLSRHAGEISFPGGLRHDEDDDLARTALRETQEELGIEPSSIEVLGVLSAVHTFVSGILIVPFVGLLSAPPSYRPNDAEIAEVLEFALADLDAAEAHLELPRGDHVSRGYAYEMPGATIWGATAFILHDLLETIRDDRRSGSMRSEPTKGERA